MKSGFTMSLHTVSPCCGGGAVSAAVVVVVAQDGSQCRRSALDDRLWGSLLLFCCGVVLWVRGGSKIWDSILLIIVSVALCLPWTKLYSPQLLHGCNLFILKLNQHDPPPPPLPPAAAAAATVPHTHAQDKTMLHKGASYTMKTI